MTASPCPSFPILLVDDEPAWLRSLSMTLEGPGGLSNLVLCRDSREVMAILESRDVGLVLLDLTMPHVSGEELLERIVAEHPGTAVIVVSGLNQLETAVKCMRQGAFDYFVKTDDEERILDGVRRAVRMQELERENRDLRRRFLSDTLDHPEVFADIVTADPAMRSVFQYVEAVAASSQPILITGESGTGKELIARAVHRLARSSGPLVSVNVAGLDDTMFADTLFGHVKGAFTGAAAPRSGMIEQAAGGTLFLDEIGDLGIPSQVKLLRLLQEGEYYPLGSDVPKKIQARIVVATHQDLAARQAAGAFRKDLYYRLRAHQVHLPALRRRKADIPLLLDHFLQRSAETLGKKKPTPPRELSTLLSTYDFPGNVRELEAIVHDAVSLHSSRILSMEPFLKAIGQGTTMSGEGEAVHEGDQKPFENWDRLPTLSAAADLLVQEALRRAEGNQTIAARLLGISQPALSKRLKQPKQD